MNNDILKGCIHNLDASLNEDTLKAFINCSLAIIDDFNSFEREAYIKKANYTDFIVDNLGIISTISKTSKALLLKLGPVVVKDKIKYILLINQIIDKTRIILKRKYQ